MVTIDGGLTVLSLFDGMSCGQIALRELGTPVRRYYASETDKFCIAPALCSSRIGHSPLIITPGDILRRLTPTECARLQTIPDWYKWECSETQQYRMLGNGWTVEVIKHILKYL